MAFLVELFLFYGELPFAYRFIIAVISITVFLSILTFFGIIVARTRNNNQEFELQEFQKIVEEKIQLLLFSEEFQPGSKDYNSFVRKYRASKLSAPQRKGLSQLILYMHKRIKGADALKLEQFYKDIGLRKKALRNLSSNKWWVRIWNVRVLSELNVRESRKGIIPKVHSKIRDEHTQALFAIMKLDGLKSINLLPKLKYELTQWDQVVLMEQVKQEPPADLPDVTPLLNSNNATVVEFGVKLVGFFELVNYKKQIEKLVTHDSDRVRVASVVALRRMFDTDGIPLLIERYDELTRPEKNEMFETIREIGSPDNVPFLWSVFENDEDVDFRLKSLQCLKSIKGKSVLESKKSQYSEGSDELRLLNHSLDGRI